MTAAALSFRADLEAGGLYDAHARRFAPIEHGACMASGFTPFYLAQVFGVPQPEWPRLLSAVQAELAKLEPAAAARRLEELRPKRSLGSALELALLVYPSAERFLERRSDAHAPYALRDDVLHQANLPLVELLEGRGDRKRSLVEPGQLGSDAGRLEAAAALGAFGAPEAPPLEPGLYCTGHSTLLIRTERAGLLIDPISLSPLSSTANDPIRAGELSASTTALALTHGHFDHYHLPTLLALSDRPLIVPSIPGATVVCEDIAGRLAEFGRAGHVLEPAWGTRWEHEDLRVHVLPFRGEQFLTSEVHPRARNWGNAYVVETPQDRVLVAADCGFEPGHTVFDVVGEWVEANGPIRTVVAQCIGLHVALGAGDPDILLAALACPHRAPEAFELLAPERRVTLSAPDLPELLRVAGASRFVPYGQFSFERGAASVVPEVLAQVRSALAESGCEVEVVAPRIGAQITP